MRWLRRPEVLAQLRGGPARSCGDQDRVEKQQQEEEEEEEENPRPLPVVLLGCAGPRGAGKALSLSRADKAAAPRMVAHSSLTPENGITTELRSRLEPPARDPRQAQPSHRHGPPGAPQVPRDTHFHTFRSQEDFNAIIRASALLEECGFYWGPLSVRVAHEKLKGEPVGTFLLRDSRQKNCFFTVSVKTATGPTSIRIIFTAGRFHLDGSHESFDCLFKLLEHYASTPRKVLVRPLPKKRLRTLQELCRRRIVATVGRENLSHIPLNPVLKDYLESFPFKF